jgi:hypothetical protein
MLNGPPVSRAGVLKEGGEEVNRIGNIWTSGVCGILTSRTLPSLTILTGSMRNICLSISGFQTER